jgi:S-adenosylmethionine:tRNA ribosyltransferase-isomerase
MSRSRQQNDGPLPISLFDYELPEELIAQRPLEDRSASRLLVLDRSDGSISHSMFRDIGEWLRPGDLLVLNNTRVFPARLYAQRATGGRVEILLLQDLGNGKWQGMARPSRRLRDAETLAVLDRDEYPTQHEISVGRKQDDGTLVLDVPNANQVLAESGRVPLPSYITEKLDDPDRYQTVYADESGSVAAPTAGLHFTQEILDQLRQHRVEIAYVTLHVGPGTFQPVKVEDALKHQMHAERYVVSGATLEQLRNARNEGRRVIAVGTTSCRTLESIADRMSEFGPIAGNTSLYITPGFKFSVVDALLTNFHLPKSTLLLLVSALTSRELVLRSYSEAIARRYRFYSFGDAMLIV